MSTVHTQSLDITNLQVNQYLGTIAQLSDGFRKAFDQWNSRAKASGVEPCQDLLPIILPLPSPFDRGAEYDLTQLSQYQHLLAVLAFRWQYLKHQIANSESHEPFPTDTSVQDTAPMLDQQIKMVQLLELQSSIEFFTLIKEALRTKASVIPLSKWIKSVIKTYEDELTPALKNESTPERFLDGIIDFLRIKKQRISY